MVHLEKGLTNGSYWQSPDAIALFAATARAENAYRSRPHNTALAFDIIYVQNQLFNLFKTVTADLHRQLYQLKKRLLINPAQVLDPSVIKDLNQRTEGVFLGDTHYEVVKWVLDTVLETGKIPPYRDIIARCGLKKRSVKRQCSYWK